MLIEIHMQLIEQAKELNYDHEALAKVLETDRYLEQRSRRKQVDTLHDYLYWNVAWSCLPEDVLEWIRDF